MNEIYVRLFYDIQWTHMNVFEHLFHYLEWIVRMLRVISIDSHVYFLYLYFKTFVMEKKYPILVNDKHQTFDSSFDICWLIFFRSTVVAEQTNSNKFMFTYDFFLSFHFDPFLICCFCIACYSLTFLLLSIVLPSCATSFDLLF